MKQQISDYVFKPVNLDKDRNTLANEIDDLLDRSGQKPPSLETMKKMISTFRNQRNPLDVPWHLGTLQEHHLSEYAVNRIFLLKPFAEHREPVFEGGLQTWQVITIRDARWIARLSALPMSLEWLWCCAQAYSRQEKIAELAGTLFDSSELDNDMANALAQHPKIFFLPNPNGAIIEMCQDKEFDAQEKIRTTMGYLRPVLEYLIKKEEAQNERTHS